MEPPKNLNSEHTHLIRSSYLIHLPTLIRVTKTLNWVVFALGVVEISTKRRYRLCRSLQALTDLSPKCRSYISYGQSLIESRIISKATTDRST